MKIAVFSDVHANSDALNKVFEDAEKEGCERFVCLGDIVGYGCDPAGCIDICRGEKGVECVLGNHDAGVIGELGLSWFSPVAMDGVVRHRGELDDDRKSWLRTLKHIKSEEFGGKKCCFAHGTYYHPESFGYLNTTCEAKIEQDMMKSGGCDILFVGHTHYAEAFALDKKGEFDRVETIEDGNGISVNLGEYDRPILNVGSVGWPRNQWSTIYVVFDTDKMEAKYRVLPFDFAKAARVRIENGIAVPAWMERARAVLGV